MSDSIKSLLSPAFELSDEPSYGAQLIDGEWWNPMFGCDSLQMVVDNAIRLINQPLVPIPREARLPEPSECAEWADDPDCTHWCWVGKSVDGGTEWMQHSAVILKYKNFTHWLPASAMPLLPEDE